MRRRLDGLVGHRRCRRRQEAQGAPARAVEEKIVPLIAEKRVKIVIDATFPLREAAAAHTRMDAAHVGKIVLTV